MTDRRGLAALDELHEEVEDHLVATVLADHKQERRLVARAGADARCQSLSAALGAHQRGGAAAPKLALGRPPPLPARALRPGKREARAHAR